MVAEDLSDRLAQANELLSGTMPTLTGRLLLATHATPAALAPLGPDALRLAELLRARPRTAIELLADAGGTVDVALALSKLQMAGYVEVDRRRTVPLIALGGFLVLAAVSAWVVLYQLSAWWAGESVWALAGICGLIIALGGSLVAASALRRSLR